MLVLGKSFQLSPKFTCKARTCASKAPLLGRLLPSLTNISLGGKGLASEQKLPILELESPLKQLLGLNVIKHFLNVICECL